MKRTSRLYFNSPATSLYDPASGSSYAAVPRTGNNAGSFFLGVANQYTLNAARSSYNLLEREYAAYLQDDFKVSPRLTLNLGLRYENFPAMTEANNLLSGFDLNSHSVVIGRSLEDLYRLGVTTPEVVADYQQVGVKFITPQEAGQPAGIVKGNPWNFGPRAGFAWRLGSGARTTVIREGIRCSGTTVTTAPLRVSCAPIRPSVSYAVLCQTTPRRARTDCRIINCVPFPRLSRASTARTP